MCSNCTGNYENPHEDFEQGEEVGQDLEQEPDFDDQVHEEKIMAETPNPLLDHRAAGYVARHDPEAMETYIITDRAKALIFKVCDAAHVVPPNPISMGSAVELIRGLTEFNAEQMLTRSLTANGLDITLLRHRRLEFDRNVAA